MNPAGSTLLGSHIQLPRLQPNLLGSVLLHAGLIALVYAAEMLLAPRILVIGTGLGGGQGGETVRVGLTGALDGGSGELFKPSLRPEPPAVPQEPIKPSRDAAQPKAPAEDDFQVRSPKGRRNARVKQTAAVAPAKQSAPIEENRIPRQTGPGTGGAGGAAGGSGGGFGGGQGVHIGPGSGGDPLMDSWYARQVEKRIGENWLRTNFESLAGKHLTTVLRFEILPDGRIDNVVAEQRSGVTFYDLAAERAIRSSNPLPRPPAEFQNRAIRFVCYFEYPPAGGL